MLRSSSARTSFRPTLKPSEFSLRIAFRIADFFRLVVEPVRTDPGRISLATFRPECLAFGRLMSLYLRARFALFSFEILIARTFFIMRRNVFLSAFDNPTIFVTHILSDVVRQFFFR